MLNNSIPYYYNFVEYLNTPTQHRRKEKHMNRIDAIERVLDKRAGRGASDKSLIGWLNNLKRDNKWFNKVLDGFVDAIKQTPLNTNHNEEDEESDD